MKKPDRVIELQRQIKICRDALARIQGGCRSPEQVAAEALYEMMPSDPKYPLQGLVGHERRALPDDPPHPFPHRPTRNRPDLERS